MADLTVTVANLRELDAVEGRRIPMIADEAVERGQPLYRKTNGRAGLARGNAVGTAKLVGIATSKAAAGSPVDALYFGRLVGYGLGSVNPGSTVYLSSATAGALADAAPAGTGNVVVAVGTVHTMTDVAGTKFLFVDIPQNAAPVALA